MADGDLNKRSARINRMVKKRAKGYCEACGKKIEMYDNDGDPIVFVHHIVPISEGGEDSVYNTAAICADCHMRIHYASDGIEYNEGLKQKIIEKQRKIDVIHEIEAEKHRHIELERLKNRDLEEAIKKRQEERERRKRELFEEFITERRKLRRLKPL